MGNHRSAHASVIVNARCSGAFPNIDRRTMTAGRYEGATVDKAAVPFPRVVRYRISFPFHSSGDAGRGPAATQIRRAEEAITSGVAIIGDCRE